MKHKVVQAIDDSLVEELRFTRVKHTAAVTNEALSVFSTLSKPPTGFKKLMLFEFNTLDSRVSPTVIE